MRSDWVFSFWKEKFKTLKKDRTSLIKTRFVALDHYKARITRYNLFSTKVEP